MVPRLKCKRKTLFLPTSKLIKKIPSQYLFNTSKIGIKRIAQTILNISKRLYIYSNPLLLTRTRLKCLKVLFNDPSLNKSNYIVFLLLIRCCLLVIITVILRSREKRGHYILNVEKKIRYILYYIVENVIYLKIY